MKCFKGFIALLVAAFFVLPIFSAQASEINNRAYTPKVVNGTKPVNMKNWGFIARVYDNESSCTGILIDQYWVLTAAHCVNDDNLIKRFRGKGSKLVQIFVGGSK